MEKAYKAIEENKNAQAFAYYSQALELDEENIYARINRAAIFEKNAQYDVALSEYEQIINRELAQERPSDDLISEYLYRYN